MHEEHPYFQKTRIVCFSPGPKVFLAPPTSVQVNAVASPNFSPISETTGIPTDSGFTAGKEEEPQEARIIAVSIKIVIL